jgi:serine/threonine-protein kinase
MRLMEGGSLSRQIDVGPVASRRAAQWLLEVTRAVDAAHENNVVHRDLKPGNVVLDASGIAHVTDFGLAKRLSQDASLTAAGTLMGTVGYMAPEQTYGTATFATDIYGLGAILYALLTGRPPFKSDTIWDTVQHVRNQEPAAPRLLNPKTDRDLERLCLKCLEKDPLCRYVSAAEMAEDLVAYLAGDPLPHNPRPGLLSAVLRPVERELQVEPLKQFSRSNLMSAAASLVSHTAVFAIIQTGQPIALAWLALACLWTQGAVNVWVFLIRPARSAHPVEGYVVVSYVGYLLAYPVLFISGGLGQASELLSVYPYLATLTGFLVFIQGGLFWGRLYLAGLGYFVLAFVMRLSPEWAPLEFGLCHCAFLVLMSRHSHTARRGE